jgi:hypothetical protein
MVNISNFLAYQLHCVAYKNCATTSTSICDFDAAIDCKTNCAKDYYVPLTPRTVLRSTNA